MSDPQPLNRQTTDFARLVLVVLAVAAVFRLILAANLGLGIDETYTVVTARHLEWSYFDHPPLAWWIAGLTERLAGTEWAPVVRLPFILLGCLTGWMLFLLTRLLFDARAGFLAVLAYVCAPVTGVTAGTFVVPDAPLMLAMVAGAYALARALFRPTGEAGHWWIAAGICGGLALLSKYHGIFLFAGAGLFLLTSASQRRWFLSPWPYLGFLIAVAIFLPVLVWNAEHGWVSFLFQGGRGGEARLRPLAPLTVLGGQALFLLPWIWFGLVATGIGALRRGPADGRSWLLLCLGVGPILVFTLVAAWSSTRVFPHWAAPGYLMLFPLLGAAVSARWDKAGSHMRGWAKATAIVTGAAIILASVFARIGWPPVAIAALEKMRDPLIETTDWHDLSAALAQRGLLGKPNTFATGLRWLHAAKIDYGLRGQMPVLCLCDDPRGYGMLAPAEPFVGQDAVIVRPLPDIQSVESLIGKNFERIEPLGTVDITRAGKPSLQAELYLGHRLKPGWQPPWKQTGQR